MIADSLGIEYPKQVMAGLSPEERRVLAVSLNVDRRHLTDGQQVVLGKKIEPDIAKIANARMVAATLPSSDGRVAPRYRQLSVAGKRSTSAPRIIMWRKRLASDLDRPTPATRRSWSKSSRRRRS